MRAILALTCLLLTSCGADETRLTLVIEHELGHAGGLPHASGTIMAPDYRQQGSELAPCPRLAPHAWIVEPGLGRAFDAASAAWCAACGWCPKRWDGPGLVEFGELPPGKIDYFDGRNTITIISP